MKDPLKKKTRGPLSTAGRKAIAEAQKKRWAARREAKNETTVAPVRKQEEAVSPPASRIVSSQWTKVTSPEEADKRLLELKNQIDKSNANLETLNRVAGERDKAYGTLQILEDALKAERLSLRARIEQIEHLLAFIPESIAIEA